MGLLIKDDEVERLARELGDCLAYATARRFDARLLFKGNDFPQTDIETAR